MTTNIQEILAERKKFIADIFQFYTQNSQLLDELKEAIIERIMEDLETESKLYNRHKKRLLRLTHFTQEIDSWKKIQKDRELNKKQIIEISYLKSSFEKQHDEAEKHYFIFLNDLADKKEKWKQDIALYLVRTINQNTQHKAKKAKIDESLEFLKNYCHNWKSELLDSLNETVVSLEKLQNFIEELAQEIDIIERSEKLETVDQTVAYLLKLKRSKVENSCKELSNQMGNFVTIHDVKAMSLKLNFEDDFFEKLDFFYDNSMSGIKANLKIIKSLEDTKEKLSILQEKIESIEKIFKLHHEHLSNKKNKMIELCVFSQKLEEETAYRWIESNLKGFFTPIDEKLNRLKQISDTE